MLTHNFHLGKFAVRNLTQEILYVNKRMKPVKFVHINN